jgi:hypothetical protein
MSRVWIWIGIGLAGFVFLFFGSFAFYRTPEWTFWAWRASLGVAIPLGGAYVIYKFRYTPAKDRLGLIFGAPILAFACGWILIGTCLPNRFTTLAGERVSFVAQLRTREPVSMRFTCRYRVSGAALHDSWTSYYCAGRAEFARLPESGYMRIRGRHSWFGLHVDEIVPASDPP